MGNLIDLINADTWDILTIDISDDESQFYLKVLNESYQFEDLVFDIREDIKKDSSFKSNLLDTLDSKFDVHLPSPLAKINPLGSHRHISSNEDYKRITVKCIDILDYTPLYSELLQASVEVLDFLCAGNDEILRDLNYISDYQKLKQILLSHSGIGDFSPLDSESLQTTVEKLYLDDNKNLDDIAFCRNYKTLKRINLSECPNILDYSPLDSESLQATVERLYLYGNKSLDDITFYRNYKTLKSIDLSRCPNISDFSPLDSESLQATVEILYLDKNKGLDDIAFCRNYKTLKLIHFSECPNLCDFSPLDSESLQTTVENLYLDDNKNLDDITFCRNYKTLKRINLSGCPNISDYSPLDSESLQSTVEWLSLSGAQLSSLNELDSYSDRQLDFGFVGEETEINNSNQDFCNIRNLINLSFLKDYKVLRDLIIEEVEIKDIYPLLDYEFVRNGSLKRIDLGNSIDWNRKDENGKYVNGEAVQELIRLGVKVNLPKNFFYAPQKEDKEDEIRTLFQKAGLEDEIYIEKAKEYDVQQKLEGGFSSNIIVSSDESVIKISGNKPAQNELKIYSLDLKQMNAFIPKLKDFLKLDNTTLMVLSNVRNCESGFHKSGFHDPILHNLYLMGLFHKEATKAVGKNGILMDSLIYETLDGEKHYESMTIPLSHFNKQESREFRYESPYNLVKQVSPIIEDVNAYIIEDADTIVHGDWKLENTVNGHIFDFGVSRRGKEVEDISYFLSEMNFKFKSEQMDQYIDYYIKFRSLHDCEFANDTKKHLEIKKYFIPARLKELSIRTGVRRKRKQTEENTQIRRYYIEQMKESYNQRNLMFS